MLDPAESLEAADVYLKYILVEKQERVERLRLGRCGDVLSAREMIGKWCDAVDANICRALLGMEVDIAPNPVAVGFLRAPAEVARPLVA